MLAPNNLPRLNAKDGHCILIATPREDWDAIEHLPVFDALRRFALPVLIETPPPSDSSYKSVLQHQTFSLKRLFEAAYERKAYGCAVWPDTITADGFVLAMLRWVAAGYHLVMQPFRLFNSRDLKAGQGLLAEAKRSSATAEPLIITPRVVGELSVRHLHPELNSMEEGHPHQPLHPPYRFWRMPGDKGLILHVLFATPVLIDFAVVPPNHTQCLDSGDWETHYVGQNFSECGGLYRGQRIPRKHSKYHAGQVNPVRSNAEAAFQNSAPTAFCELVQFARFTCDLHAHSTQHGASGHVPREHPLARRRH